MGRSEATDEVCARGGLSGARPDSIRGSWSGPTRVYGCTSRGALSLKTAKEKSILRRTIDGTHTIGFSSSRSIHFCNKKNSTIFDLTTRTVPLKSTPKLGKKATHDGADSAIRRPPRSLSARRRRRNFWP